MATANFNDLFDSDYIKELVNRNSNKLVDELYYHLTDNGISFSYDKLYDMVYDYVASPVKKDLSTFYENTTDKYNNMFKLLNDNLEYVRSNGTFEGKNVDESTMYAKDLIEQVDMNMEQFKGEHQYYDMDNYYDELSNMIEKLLAIYEKEDCYYEMKHVIETAKEKNNLDCSLEYSDASIKSLKALQEVNYQMLGIIENKAKDNNQEQVQSNSVDKNNRNIELIGRIRKNLPELEKSSNTITISRNTDGTKNGVIISDYINSKSLIDASSDGYNNPDNAILCLDDMNIYSAFAEFLADKEISFNYTIFECIQEYMDKLFGKAANYDSVKRYNLYDQLSNDNNVISISSFYNYSNAAGPIERSAVVHNLMKLMNIEDYLVLGNIKNGKNPREMSYAYNVTKSKRGSYILYDSFGTVQLENGDYVPMTEIIEGVESIDDFKSYTPTLHTIPILYGKKVYENSNHNREYISPNYYKNMQSNLSDKADEMIRQMEQGVDVEGTGEYNNQNINGRQMGYTMIGIVCLLSIISSIGIIILGVMLR